MQITTDELWAEVKAFYEPNYKQWFDWNSKVPSTEDILFLHKKMKELSRNLNDYYASRGSLPPKHEEMR